MYLEEGEIQKGRANTLQTSFHQKVIKNYPDFNFFFSFPSLMDTARQMIGSEGGDFPAREAAFCVATEIRKNNYKQKIEKGLQTENNVTHQRFPFCGTTEVHLEVDPPP